MTPVEYNLTMNRGVTFSRTLYIKNDDGTTKDLAGADVNFKIVSQDGQTTYLALGIGTGIDVVAAEGKITVTVSSTQTQNFQSRLPKAFYYLNITEGPVVTRYMQGSVDIAV